MIACIADDHPVARKQHRCELCDRIIEPGERYNRQRNIGVDGPYVFKACAHCAALVSLVNLDYDQEYTADDLWEWDPGTFGEARWKVQYHRKWRRRDGTLYATPAPLTPGTTGE